MSSIKRLSQSIAVAILAVSATLVAPSVAQAATPIGGGAPIVLGGTSLCTVTAAGTDRSGTPVAFTAGHCSSAIGEPVTIPGQPQAGVIGTIQARNEVLDYSVIKLIPGRAFPVRQAGVSATGPLPNFGEVVCKTGATTGDSCGITWQQQDGWFWSQTCAGHGDSGAPAVAGGRLVGLVSGGDMPPAVGPLGSVGKALPPCLNPIQSPFFLPAVGVSFDTIMADATARNWPGAGFVMA